MPPPVGRRTNGRSNVAASTSENFWKYPNEAAGWYWAVRANQKLGMAALARAGEVEPDSPRIHALLGDAYQRRSMFDEAREEYSKVLAVSPDSVAGLAGMAKADYADGKLEEARSIAQKALARSPADGGGRSGSPANRPFRPQPIVDKRQTLPAG